LWRSLLWPQALGKSRADKKAGLPQYKKTAGLSGCFFVLRNFIRSLEKGAALLRGPVDFARTEALCADFHPSCLSAADIDHDAPKVNQPAPPCMTVRVAYGVSRAGTSSATVAKL
jgi:hypothetical protein